MDRIFSKGNSEIAPVTAKDGTQVPDAAPVHQDSTRFFWIGAHILGLLSFLVLLAFHNIADGDLWARLSIGGEIVQHGHFPRQDLFAFVPTLPQWIDHEWGAGTLFFLVLKVFGPAGLMGLKMVLALGGIELALLTARQVIREGAQSCSSAWSESAPHAERELCAPGAGGRLALFLLAIPAALCLLGGYVPVVRSHAFTFFFFALTLFLLEGIRHGRRWPAPALVLLMLVWANVHGGFVAGLGICGIYAAWMLLRGEPESRLLSIACLGSLAVTLINPYGINYWRYLVPALLQSRSQITEWQAAPLLSLQADPFLGIRILLPLALLILLFGWRWAPARTRVHPGWLVILVTAVLACRSRRHAPFFGLACLAFLGPFLEALGHRMAASLGKLRLTPWQIGMAIFSIYAGLAAWAATRYLPQASLQVLAPTGFYPVRELDILTQAQASGNVAVPFRWGSYVAWRAYPRLKVSMDGRYETVFPESSFLLNENFYRKSGAHWDDLLRAYKVDYIIVEIGATALKPEDLAQHGYALVWRTGETSALFARQELAAKLVDTASHLPNSTIEPLDPAISKAWSD